MSSAIRVYAVSLERLKRVVGSGDQRLIDVIREVHAERLSSVDWIGRRDEGRMTCAEAVADLVYGGTPRGPGYLYGHALEVICAQIGIMLTDIGPVSRAAHWVEDVDAVLERMRVPIRLLTLLFGGSPVPIRTPLDDPTMDGPSIGRWEAGEIAAALAAMRSADLADVDREMAETLRMIRGWLERAARLPDASIIGFLS
jgi:hypothetical protein